MLYYFSFQTSLGVQLDNYRIYTWNSFMTITYAGDGDCFQTVKNRIHGGGYFSVELFQSFLYTALKYLTMTVHPQKFPGVHYRIAKWSQATSLPRSRNI